MSEPIVQAESPAACAAKPAEARPETVHEPSVPHPVDEGVPLWVQVAVAFSVMLGAFALYRTYQPPPAAQRIYSLNVDALLSAKQLQLETTKDPVAYSAGMAEFIKALHGELALLSGSGVTVLKNDAVLSAGKTVDITPAIAAKLALSEQLAQAPARDVAQRAANAARVRDQLGFAATSPDAASAAAAGLPSSSAAGTPVPVSPVSGASDAKSASNLD
ncbi:hypothetical protein [Burkholderia sp. MBR-1]|uniref:hypothetical protein n=1 Tax=Burkholderia sp. MBR-1 TaxID=2732364 RepID=UPI0015EF5CFE|nr:hypothetical protein [Burkholderia sp. MBR-1]QMI49776.1 hypothetical protein MBR110_30350 [Burkholderia sp. MBR-1]